MSGQKRQNIYFSIAASFSVLLAVFGFVSAAGSGGTARRVLLIICSILLLALSALYVYVILLSRNREPNFFLFDRLTGRNIPPEKLTWRMVNDKLTLYIADNIGSERLLWSGDVLYDESKFGYRAAYRPLIAYRMLCDVARDESEGGNAGYFRLLEQADEKRITLICRILDESGDTEMARALLLFKRSVGASEPFKRYLAANTRYLQGRMLGYVRRNIEYFY